ncbi:MAG: UDP-N-acetylmuramoyl-tripeptide--D-alanyl-D-alanine ligase [Limisphaerales bacterium]
MRKRNLQFIADATNGKLSGGDPATEVLRICTDSRAVRPGDLFIALKGERFDAHDYLADVTSKGAIALVVETGRGLAETGVVEVGDTRKALGRIAAAHRAEFNIPVVAVGGSNGKTTTKELIAAVLREMGDIVWSEASFNNDIGVPLTLARLDDEHQAIVQEVGTNHPGEMSALLELVKPHFGVITSIGREHLEHFGDLEGVIKEEGTLAEVLPKDGVLFVDGDGPFASRLAALTNARVVRVGSEAGNDYRFTDVRMTFAGMKFSVSGPNGLEEEFQTPLLGRHQACNATLALAVGTELGLTSEQSRRALANCTPPRGRLHLWEENGVHIVDDSYNANADSMCAAIDTLSELPVTGRRIAVLGNMAELGEHAEAAHREIGAHAASKGIDMLFTVGGLGYCYAGAARDAGMKVVSEFDETAEAVASLRRVLRPGDAVLIKASRSAALERIAEALRGQIDHGRSKKDQAAIAA